MQQVRPLLRQRVGTATRLACQSSLVTFLHPACAGAGMADATSGSQEHPEAGLGLEVLLDTPAAPAAEDSRDPLLCSALAAAVKQPHGLDRTCSNSTSGSIRSPPARSLTSSSLSSSNSTSRGVVASLGALPHHSPASSLQPSLPSCEHLPNSTNHADQACPALHTHQQQAGQAPLRPYNWAPEKRARSVFFARVPPAVSGTECAWHSHLHPSTAATQQHLPDDISLSSNACTWCEEQPHHDACNGCAIVCAWPVMCTHHCPHFR
jgi:hypothetical protein